MKEIQSMRGNLLNAGIKPSYQRIKIYEYIFNNNIHPTVDNIYKKLLKEIPTLSKTTVYNTLKLFEVLLNAQRFIYKPLAHIRTNENASN